MGIDPIVPACEAVLNLQQFVSREMDPTEPAVVTVGMFNAGTATNVIPDDGHDRGDRPHALARGRAARSPQAIERRCAGIAAAGGAHCASIGPRATPPPSTTRRWRTTSPRVARQTLGADRYFPVARPSMGGEDFAYYLEKVPGCFFLVGVEPPGRDGLPAAAQRPVRLHRRRAGRGDADVRGAGDELPGLGIRARGGPRAFAGRPTGGCRTRSSAASRPRAGCRRSCRRGARR